MRLDVSPLRSAVGQLERSLDYLHSDLASEDAGLREQFRAACVQAFEFVYELSTKFILRELEKVTANPSDLRKMEFMSRMRAAADAGLIESATPWHAYRELRNRTSHTYDQDEAEAVVAALPAFLEETQKLARLLEDRNRA